MKFLSIWCRMLLDALAVLIDVSAISGRLE